MSSGDRSPLIEDVAAQQEREEAAAAELNPDPNPEDVVDQAEREAPEGSPAPSEDVPSPALRQADGKADLLQIDRSMLISPDIKLLGASAMPKDSGDALFTSIGLPEELSVEADSRNQAFLENTENTGSVLRLNSHGLSRIGHQERLSIPRSPALQDNGGFDKLLQLDCSSAFLSSKKQTGRQGLESLGYHNGDDEEFDDFMASTPLINNNVVMTNPIKRRLSMELSTRIKTAVYQLSVPLFVWKRGMGLETCTYPLHLNETPVTWPTAAHICSPFLVVFYTFVTLLSVGVQWLRCRHAYAIRYELGDNYFNSTTVEYSCQGSFLWMFLLPRLLGLGAYFILFVSWYWMRHLELMTLTYKIQDVIVQEDSYVEISTRFLRYLGQDRTVVVVTFLVALSLSVVGTLMGDGIVFNDSLQADQSGFTFSVIGEVFNFLVTALTNCAVTYCLVGHLLGLKYLELCLDKVSVHLDAIAAGNHMTSRRFTVEAYERLDDFIDKTQPTLLVGLLIALLHVGRSVSLVMKDLGLQPVRHESLGLLPISLFFLGCIILYIHKGRKLTIKGYDCHSTCVTLGPDFVTSGESAQRQQQQGQAVVVHVENLPASPPPAASSPRSQSPDSPAQGSPPNPPAGGSPAGGSPAGGSPAGGSPARGSGSGQSGAGGSTRRESSAGGTPDRPASRRPTPMPRYEGASILQRTEEEWEEALAIAPAVAPKLAFLEVSAWMYPTLATITLLVTGVMYALQSTYPVV